MSEFFRFPHTPHLAWLAPGSPRDDKVLSPPEVNELLAGELVVEEKVDGANLGFSVSEDGELRAQNRGTYLTEEFCHEQFRSLWRWLAPHQHALIDALWPDRMLFGEWCVATHSVNYDLLPDWFVGFDVYDRAAQQFWSTTRRNKLLQSLGLAPVPHLARGHFSLEELKGMLGTSRVSSHAMEGLVVRREDAEWTYERAKLVRPTFTQNIEAHWSRGPIRRNALARPSHRPE